MFLHQLVLCVALCALVYAAWVPARRWSAGLAEAILVTAALAGTGVVLWTLALGLAGLAGSTIWLAIGPVLACAATVAEQRMRAPADASGPLAIPSPAGHGSYRPTEGGRRTAGLWDSGWSSLTALERIAAAAALGLLVGAVVEVALQPGFGTDAVEYHLPTALGWLHSGHAGSAQTLTYDFPVGYYPLTTEVIITWLLGLSNSFVPMAAIGPLTASLGALGLWRTLTAAGVTRRQSWLAAVAFIALPTVLFGVNTTGPGTDLSAVSWLLCGCGVAAGSVRSQRALLLVPAMLAFGLGIGTKTTVAPLAVIALLIAAWRLRAALRPAAAPLAGGFAVALIVGIPWYVRNWIVHGWPLWPFSQGPVGDKLPHTMKLFAYSFLSRPKVTFDSQPGAYLKNLGGGTLMVAGALAAPLIARRRAVLAASVVAVIALLAWAQAPFTGLAPNPLLDGLAITTVRYILSALVACLVAISLIARPDDRRPATATRALEVLAGLLTLATLIWSLVSDAQLGYPSIPRPLWPIVFAVVGAVIGIAVVRLAGDSLAATGIPVLGRSPALGDRLRAAAQPLRGPLALIALLIVALLADLAGPNWLGREARDGDPNAAVTAFMLSRPGYTRSDAPVSFAPAELATLAGPRLSHPLELIPARESCPATLARLRRGWIVLRPHLMAAGILTSFRAPACLVHVHPAYDDGTTVVYAPRPGRN